MTEKHPFSTSDYEVSWSSLEIGKLKEDVTQALAAGNENLSKIESLSGDEISYASVATALENSTEALDRAWNLVEHLNNVMDSSELRSVYNEILPLVTDFYSGICLRPKLWQVVSGLGGNRSILEKLSPIQRRHVEELVLDFKECGAALDGESRKRISEIDNELAAISQKFSENVLDSTNDWEYVVKDPIVVADFPEVLREIARESALSKGYGNEAQPQWRFTLHAPSIFPFMKYVNDPELRKMAWQASADIARTGKWNNGDNILKLLQLRREKAKILGFDNFADSILQRRMARNGETARDFVRRMKDAVSQTVPEEVAELEAFRAESLGLPEAEQIEPWDVAYWSEKLMKSKYDFDDEWLRPYFSVDHVIKGLFKLAETIFGLNIVERQVHVGKEGPAGSVEVWTDKVQYYEVFDRDSHLKLGAFYADWFPRESKRSGAWMDTLRSGRYGQDGKPDALPLGIICGNMTPGSQGKPALLTHSEVETVFHEFGHLIHEICGEIPVKYLNGISVPWDFVEVPSQIMENWCWERASLDLIASHQETGAPIPEQLYQKMLNARNFQKGLGIMRQLSFSIMDLDLHIDFVRNEDLDEAKLLTFAEQSIEDYRPNWKTKSPPLLYRFGHLFSSSVGYAAGYYSYQWSEVIEADAFGKFLEDGILNEETGMSFRKNILAAGNSRNPMDSYIAFRGRKPTLEAYLIRAGMNVTEDSKTEFGG